MKLLFSILICIFSIQAQAIECAETAKDCIQTNPYAGLEPKPLLVCKLQFIDEKVVIGYVEDARACIDMCMSTAENSDNLEQEAGYECALLTPTFVQGRTQLKPSLLCYESSEDIPSLPKCSEL